MTAEEFNALPLEARLYIERQTVCLRCGEANNLEQHYKNWLKMKDDQLFTLRNGAVPVKDGDKVSVLYPLGPKDTEETKTHKLELALKVNKARPEAFTQIDVEAINTLLKKEDKKAAPKAGSNKKGAGAAPVETAPTEGESLL